ncbi:competence type IV pilus minor pilin ComGF [Aerococcus kribbianus]|uniref:competence type IV pilus minor pilin ComGF n=1 Tax=Aerococcus kribbianus TaxID=2999064 RepID=UPI003AA8003A
MGFFVYQLQSDVNQAQSVEKRRSNRFVIRTQANQVISFEHYQNKDSQMIRRRVNGSGHQPMLLEVASFQVSESKEAYDLAVVFINKEAYHTCIPKNKVNQDTSLLTP